MENPVISSRSDVVAAPTEPRVTPPPPRVPFAQVLSASAASIVRGADQAASTLPGAPLLAVAFRGAASAPAASPLASTMPLSSSFPITGALPAGPALGASASSTSAASSTPEGPSTSGSSSSPLAGVASAASGAGNPSVDGALAQSQQMNLYFLQIQEEVNAQDRAYSAYSNVLKSQHDTVMTAVGNIR